MVQLLLQRLCLEQDQPVVVNLKGWFCPHSAGGGRERWFSFNSPSPASSTQGVGTCMRPAVSPHDGWGGPLSSCHQKGKAPVSKSPSFLPYSILSSGTGHIFSNSAFTCSFISNFCDQTGLDGAWAACSGWRCPCSQWQSCAMWS